MSKRNGKIELLRFVFCICIVLFHVNIALYNGNFVFNDIFSFFKRGNIGVEFFYLVSGYLLAKSAFKEKPNPLPLGSETISFMKRKLLALFSPHTVSFILTFVSVIILKGIHGFDIVSSFIKALPDYLFLNKIGISRFAVNRVEWYICCMLICMLFIYPLCRKYKKTFTNIVAPLIAIFILGYLFHKYESIENVKIWAGLVYKCMLRAAAELCLGVTAYSITDRLCRLNVSKADRIIMTAIEIACFSFSLYFVVSREKSKYAALVIIALFVGVILAFSDLTYGKKLFNNRFAYFLGKLSMPVYMIQSFARNSYQILFPNMVSNKAFTVTVITAGTVILGIGLMYISIPIDRLIMKKLKQLGNARDI